MIGFYNYENAEDIILPEEAAPNSLFIFDDIQCSSQSPIREFYSRGRHYQTNCIYLCQSLAHVQKHLIRENCNMTVLFEIDSLNLRHAYDDNSISRDLGFDEFKEMCEQCWQNDKYSFFVIDRTSDLASGQRYRNKFDGFIHLK